jgi:hypothetical protein
MYASWNTQMPDLVTAYLDWRHGCPIIPDKQSTATPASGGTVFFEVTAVTIEGRLEYHRIPQKIGERPNVSLIREGLLGCSPIDPSVAISLQCLELYHQIRRRQPSFSLQAMAKVLCALHNVSLLLSPGVFSRLITIQATYFQSFRTQLSVAFDVYLNIQRSTQQLIDIALDRKTPNWRLLHGCPPCGYQVYHFL